MLKGQIESPLNQSSTLMGKPLMIVTSTGLRVAGRSLSTVLFHMHERHLQGLVPNRH